MANVQRSLNKTGQNLQNIGSKLTANFTAPILGAIALVTKGTEEFRSDLARLSTNADIAGEDFGFVEDKLKDVYAVTGEVDSSVEGLSNLLASDFKGENLTNVLESISGAAIKFSDTLKFEGIADGLQETLATGKAIGPFSELLERSGINLDVFNSGLAESIKNGTQNNFILQTLASTGLSQVNEKFKENNKDVVDARKAQLDFQLALANLGKIVQPIATKLLSFGTKLISYFTELSPTTKKWIVILGGVLAAVGPLLALSGTILPAILTGFTILTGPIGLIAAGLTAIGVIIYKNWQPIKKTLIDIANYFIDLYNESTVFRVAVEQVVATFKTLWEIGKFVFEGLKSIIGGFIDNFVTGFKTIGKIIKAVLTGPKGMAQIPAIIKEAGKEGISNFKDLTSNLSNDWNNLIQGIQQVTNDGIANVTSRKKIKFLGENVDATAITDEVAKATSKGVVTGLQSATQSGGAGGGFNTPQVSSVNAGVEATGIVNPLGSLVTQMQESELQTKTIFANISGSAVDFSTQLNENLQAGLQSSVELFGQFIGSIATGGASLSGLFSGLMGIVSEFMKNLGKSLIQIGLAGIAAKKAFINPPAALAAGIALTILSGVIKSTFSQGFAGSFANGGIVGGSSYYGDKLFARVNSGEAIFNREQQKSLYNLIEGPGQQPIVLNGGFKVTGDTLQLMIDRALVKRERRS